MSLFSSSRHFRIWDYHISHQRLLIRSPRDQSMPGSENIDLLFQGVSYLDTVPAFNGLELEEINPIADPEEAKVIEAASGQELRHGCSCFLLRSDDRKNIICAASFFHISINSLSLAESLLDVPDCNEKMKPRPAIVPEAKTILCVNRPAPL